MTAFVKSARGGNHKQAQLCAEVAEVASLALGASTDSRLHQVMVHSVTASDDGGRLTVNVVPNEIADFGELELLMAALDRARPWLRQQVASEINRKRVPEIAFQIILSRDSE